MNTFQVFLQISDGPPSAGTHSEIVESMHVYFRPDWVVFTSDTPLRRNHFVRAFPRDKVVSVRLVSSEN